jgi:hypothetical protein
MASRIMTRGMTGTDRLVAWTMIAGLAFALLQAAQDLALPAHFV